MVLYEKSGHQRTSEDKIITELLKVKKIAIFLLTFLDQVIIRSGHSMAVQGYATIQSKSSGNQLHTLMVFDGWNEYVRYLNLDFGNWTDLRGTTFNG